MKFILYATIDMTELDKMALKWINSQASLNKMIELNKELLNRIDTILEVKKNKAEFTTKNI